MVDHASENELSCGLIVTELRAAEGVSERHRSRHRRQLFGYLVDTSDRNNDKNIVSDTNVAVVTEIAHKGGDTVCLFAFILKGGVFVFYNTRQICFHIVSMYMLTFFYIRHGVSYGIAVFDYVLSNIYIAKSVLVTIIEIYLNVVKLVNQHTLLPRRT